MMALAAAASEFSGSGIPRRINVDDKVGSKRTVYLLWGQYYDKSGHVFIGVYGTKEKAKEALDLIDLVSPDYELKIDPVEWRY